MQQSFPKLLTAGASDIGQLTDVLRCNLQESCHASAGTALGPGPAGWAAARRVRPRGGGRCRDEHIHVEDFGWSER
jgi:hypothetical protein